MVWDLFGKFATFLGPHRFLPGTFLFLALLTFLFWFFQRCTTCQLGCTAEAATPGCRPAVQLPRPPHTRPRPPHWAWPPARHRAWASTPQVSSGQILRCCFFNKEKKIEERQCSHRHRGEPRYQKFTLCVLLFAISVFKYFMWQGVWILIKLFDQIDILKVVGNVCRCPYSFEYSYLWISRQHSIGVPT